MASNPESGKEQLHQWIKRILDTEKCPGVRWIDKSERIFEIPWQNQKSASWKEENCDIFVQYAKHSGKLDATTEIHFPKLKQNFKSAIHKNRFIKRLESQSKSHRVFKLLDSGSQKALKKKQKKLTTDQIAQDEISKGNIVTPNIPCEVDQNKGQTNKQPTLSSLDLLLQSSHFILGSQTSGVEGNSCVAKTVEPEQISEVSQIENIKHLHVTSTQMLSSKNYGGNNISPNRYLLDQKVDATLNLNPTFIQSMMIDSTTGHVIKHAHNPNATNDIVEGSMDPLNEHDINKSSMASSGITENNKFPSLQGAIEEDILFKQGLNTPVQDLPCSLSDIQNSPDAFSSMDTYEGQNSLDKSKSIERKKDVSSEPAESDIVQTLPTIPQSVSEHDLMRLQVIYGTPSKVVMTTFVRTNKCRIVFGKIGHKRINHQIEQRDDGCQEIELPSVDKFDFNDKSKERILKILQILELGVVLTYRDDDIYVARRCQPHVFMSDGALPSVKLPRSSLKLPDIETKAFNFNEDFINSIKIHRVDNKNPVGKDHFMLTFGCEILVNDPSPTKAVPVYIVVQHLKAALIRCKEMGQEAYEPAPTYSMSNSFENEIRLAHTFGQH